MLILLHLYTFDVNHDNCQLQELPFEQNQHVRCIYTDVKFCIYWWIHFHQCQYSILIVPRKLWVFSLLKSKTMCDRVKG